MKQKLTVPLCGDGGGVLTPWPAEVPVHYPPVPPCKAYVAEICDMTCFVAARRAPPEWHSSALSVFKCASGSTRGAARNTTSKEVGALYFAASAVFPEDRVIFWNRNGEEDLVQGCTAAA